MTVETDRFALINLSVVITSFPLVISALKPLAAIQESALSRLERPLRCVISKMADLGLILKLIQGLLDLINKNRVKIDFKETGTILTKTKVKKRDIS